MANTLTWEDCVGAAKEKNPDLVSSEKARAASQANYKESFNGLLPSLTLSHTYTRTDSSTWRDSRWGASGRAGMDLFNLGNTANIYSASAALDQATATLRLQSADVRFNLKQAFAHLLFAQEQVNVSTRIKSLREKNAEMVALKYDSGRESKGNMLQSKAELKEAEANLSEADRNLRVAQREMNSQLGQEIFQVVTASGALTSVELPAFPDIEALTDTHPQVAFQNAATSAAEARLQNAKSSLWPTLSANYSRSFSDETYFPGNPHWSASGILSYPIFGSGLTSTYFSISSAKRTLEKANSDLTSTRNSVRTLLETNWSSLASALDQVQVQLTFLVASRQRNEEANIRYSSGLMSFEDWERLVSDLVNFERSRLRAERDAVVAGAAWEKAIGKTLEE